MFFIILFAGRCFLLALSEQVPCAPIALGMEDGTIMNDKITASSYVAGNWGSLDPWKARLNGNGFWLQRSDDKSSWIQVNLSEPVVIAELKTQGNGLNRNHDRWVRSLRVKTGNSVDTLTFVRDRNENIQEFSANVDTHSTATILLDEPIITQYLRIVPTDCENRCGLRFEVFGCHLVNECVSETDTCDTNAECYDLKNGFQCDCKNGFTGSGLQCEDINDCVSSPCMHNGTCIDGIDSNSCHCPDGFTGNRCQIDINECISSPCMYNGTCIDGIDSYSCHCADGFTGNRCQTDVGPQNMQSEKSTITPGIIAGVVIAGFLMIILALVIVCLMKRYTKQNTSSTNPRLDFDGPYDITLKANNVTDSAQHTTHDNQTFELDSSPSVIDDADDVYQEIHGHEKEFIPASVEDKSKQEKSSSEAEEGSIDIYATSDDIGVMNEGLALYASVDKSNKNDGQDNNEEEGWMDNSIYATTNDDNSQPGTAEAKKGAQDNNREEGWMDNSIYATTNDNGQPDTEEASEGWAENSINGD